MKSSLVFFFILGTFASAKIDFSRDIRPILNANCLACHGGVKKQAGVSFLYREEALSTGESGKPTVVPGDPDKSEMLIRILSNDPEEVMPQPKHGPPLSPEEANLIRQWIQEGAEWNNHWSFEKPTRHPAPAISDPSWPKSLLDLFILARLDDADLTPTPPAPADQLLRRLHLDLIGYPPTPNELDQFEKAYLKNPDQAVAEVVDRLLSHEGFGEKWAPQWLDIARYADSEGLGADRRWNAWPYRDWVIDALNQDLPYDQFLIKQIAGDFLPNPTLNDLIATKYHRLSQQNAEGGTDNEEFRVQTVMDRVNTTWTGLQGVTFECTQCHEHPYDPIHHEEYFTFAAFFNNTRDQDLDSHYPTLLVPDKREDFPAAATARAEYRHLQTNFQNQARDLIAQSSWKKIDKMAVSSSGVGSKTQLTDGYLEFLTDGTIPTGTSFTLTIPKPEGLEKITALRIHTLPVDLAEAIHSGPLGAVLSRITLKAEVPGNPPFEVPLQYVLSDDDFPEWDPNDSLKNGNTGWGASTQQYQPRSCVVVLTEPLDLPASGSLILELKHQVMAPTGPLATKRGRLDLTDSPLFQTWLNSPETRSLISQRQDALKKYQSFGKTKLAVMEDLPPSLHRDTRLFKRGNWLEKAEKPLLPGTPAVLHPLEKSSPDGPATRLDLAHWLASDENPFTSRVLVARVWGQIFGLSLVETLEDFGSSGLPPSHPELLDDLAVRFQSEMNRSLKSLLREIFTSATYRQNATTNSASRQKDPNNILLSRGPRNRLPAELIRDHHLAASGLLHHQLHGPPVFPPIPGGVWKPFSDKPWATAKIGDPNRYRRAIYTYWKRSIPFPTFDSFDSPTRENCAPRRLTSNTPIAALATLNDEAFAEMAQGLARRMKNEVEGDLTAQLTFGYRLATSTKPNPRQLEILTSLYHDVVADYQTDPSQYQPLAATPDGAAFTIVASTLLNLDETLTK